MIKIKRLKFLRIFTTLALVFGSIFVLPLSAEAVVGNLSVEFENAPLFSESNFLPGSAVTRWVKVTNNTDSVQNVVTETSGEINSDNLGDDLDLVIKKGSDVLWSGTLTDFFAASNVPLSSIDAQETIQYDYTVSMASDASNDSQGKSLGFNLVIGFDGTSDEVDDTNGTIMTSGTNGSGLPIGLTIYNEASTNVTETTATITWLTNYSATSRVIYSAEDEPHDFDYSSPPNYGYAHSTTEDPTMVISHQMELNGLIPGTLYYYRVISHASPDTVGLSYTFTTSGNKPQTSGDETESGPDQNLISNQDQGSSGSSSNDNSNSNNNPEENQPEIRVEGAQETNGQVAGEQEACNSWPWWLIIIMLLDYLILMVLNYLDKFDNKLTDLKKRLGTLFALLLIILPLLVYWFSISFAWWAWLLVVIAYIIVLLAYMIDLDSKNYWRLSVIITLYLLLMFALLKMFIC